MERRLGHRPEILVVEGSGLIALELELLLSDAGYAVTTTASVSEAWQALALRPFALAVIDVPENEEDPRALIRALYDQACRVAILTGLPDDRLANTPAAITHIQKPFDPHGLMDWAQRNTHAPD